MTTLQFRALWLVVVARSFVFGDFSKNELDALPIALQFTNPDWLPVDWYLNLGVAGSLLSLWRGRRCPSMYKLD
ncbi:MAG: hypothetical protein E4H28_06545 [Gemmatimonadales bacterium]|nr:MAG: hypothetical protein E4H28_06545 [Gemmatimonadales bacterium]